MSVSLILCLTTLALLLATAAIGLAIAVLERRGIVPLQAESAFFGLAAAGCLVLVGSVVMLHPSTAGRFAGDSGLPSVAGAAMAAEVVADAHEDGDLRCVSLAELPAYDRRQARSDGRGAKGESGHEVSVFRSPGSR